MQDVKNFRSSYKLAFNLEACKTTIGDVLRSADIDDMEMPNCKDFGEMLLSLRGDAAIRRRQACEDLQLMCGRANVFDELVEATRDRLHDSTQNHLFKYCVSFAQEMNVGQQLETVLQYADKIRQTEASIEAKMTHMDNLIVAYSELKMLTVARYLESDDMVRRNMEDTCTCLVEISAMMKRWLEEDKLYTTKLWDSIIVNNIDRGKLMESLKKLGRKRETTVHSLGKRQLIHDKTSQKFDALRTEKKKTKTSREVVTTRVDTQERELDAKKTSLDGNENKIQNRKFNSPRYLDNLWLRSQTLKTEIQKLQESIITNGKHLSRLQREEQNFKQMCESTEKELMLQELQVKTFKEQLKELDEQKAKLDRELTDKEETVATLKRIREMKLSGTSLRKIYFQKMDSSTQGEYCTCNYNITTIIT